MSVGHHLISPASEGLFQRAIIQSGTVFNAISLHNSENRAYYASTLAEAVECTDEMGSEFSQ